MKYITAALLLAPVAIGAAQPVQRAPANLRQVLEQYRRKVAPPPRELSPAERAELRRQLAESARAVRTR